MPVEHLTTLAPRIIRAQPSSAKLQPANHGITSPIRPNGSAFTVTNTLPSQVGADIPAPTVTLPIGTDACTVSLSEVQLDGVRNDLIKLLGGEIDQVGKDVALVGQKVTDLMHGTYELPLASLSSQDAARLNQRCAALEVQVRDFNAWAKEALNDLPIITTVSDTTSLSVLAPLLRPTRSGAGSIGAQLSRSVTLPHDKVIEVDTHMVLNGNGESISFSGGNAEQLRITSGGILTLENITLKNLHEHTIMIEPGGTLVCADNVYWELHNDMVIESGRIEIAGENSVVHMRV